MFYNGTQVKNLEILVFWGHTLYDDDVHTNSLRGQDGEASVLESEI
jgi:hypothetical protein